MNAILIARVSTEEQKEAGNSLPAQLARLEKYCRNKGLEIIKEFSFDESAYTTERGEFDRIIDFVLAQTEEKVTAVCCDVDSNSNYCLLYRYINIYFWLWPEISFVV